MFTVLPVSVQAQMDSADIGMLQSNTDILVTSAMNDVAMQNTFRGVRNSTTEQKNTGGPTPSRALAGCRAVGLQVGRIDHDPVRFSGLAHQLGKNAVEHT